MAFDGDHQVRGRGRRRSTLLVGGGLVALVAVIAVAGTVIVKSGMHFGGAGAKLAGNGSPSSGPPPVRALAPSTVQFPTDDEAGPALDLGPSDDAGSEAPVEDASPLDDDGAVEEPVGDEKAQKPAAPRHFATVREAERGSCTTESIEGLSKQIIDEARCLNPSAVVPLPSRANLVTGPHVFPYLQAEARDHLLKVLDAHKGTTLKVNSALRTVAQQYLVWRWSATKSCGVELATRPGESSHELGLALDVADHTAWKSALEAEKFHWLGATDKVHFDFKPPTSVRGSMTDVLAFQRLWNRNHPTERLKEDGLYTPATEERLKEAPADGFKTGAVCKRAGTKPR